MIYKRCPRCRQRIPSGTTCPCMIAARQAAKKARDSERVRKDYEAFYKTALWQRCVEQAKAKTFGLDPISLMVEQRIEYGQAVHHIYPLEDYPDLRADLGNLIYITESHHRLIHKLYSQGKQAETAKELKIILENFKFLFIITEKLPEGGILDSLDHFKKTAALRLLSSKF